MKMFKYVDKQGHCQFFIDTVENEKNRLKSIALTILMLIIFSVIFAFVITYSDYFIDFGKGIYKLSNHLTAETYYENGKLLRR